MADEGFVDRFGRTSTDYAAGRPTYPPELIRRVVEACRRHRLAWDCGTGTGQAAGALADCFEQVLATDRSLAQIQAAPGRAGVGYAQAAAEYAPLRDGTVDLITVAQAFHWFDAKAFFAEAGRVLVSGGTLALWSYGMPSAAGRLGHELRHLHDVVLGDYWPAARWQVVNGYQGVQLPFPEEPTGRLSMERSFNRASLLRYLGSWSAVAEARAAGRDVLTPWSAALDDLPEPIVVTWPLILRLARKP